ncbi:hypothetical protein PISMIDRAFT_685566 [Pisolithus microcarpus 441]|uniref:Rad51-like C-terminal domain-containing protein n=1 Tax=Pisolithus microcarpus 441 TaxID=765257 RepID=A0A0C9YT24_9AGAM|nr:hypothetical protein BKA83DRAFT_685566 [Pisolithus microcarpus]KIK17184.1 hypothetical protein PISMIDRAFT_685566 [Pisolithus microcarpus 441]
MLPRPGFSCAKVRNSSAAGCQELWQSTFRFQRSLPLMRPTNRTCGSGRAEERVAKLVDSPDRPESEASYKLDEGGWSDV